MDDRDYEKTIKQVRDFVNEERRGSLGTRQVLKLFWNAIVGIIIVCLYMAGTCVASVSTLMMIVGAVAPFAFLGFGGALAIAVSALFVLEATAVLIVLALCCTTGGPGTIKNTLSYIFRHWSNGKLGLFLGGGAVLIAMLVLMAPGFPLAATALPLFASSAIGGTAVLVMVFLVAYTVLFAVAERVVALSFVGAINLARKPKGTGMRTLLGFLGPMALTGLTGDSAENIAKCIEINTKTDLMERVFRKTQGDSLQFRFWPAIVEAAITDEDVVSETRSQGTEARG